MTTADRTDPLADVAAEEICLGRVMVGLEPFEKLRRAGIHADHFVKAEHRTVFAAMLAIDQEGKAITWSVLRPRLQHADGVRDVDSLLKIADHSAAFNFEASIGIVREKASLREFLRDQAAALDAIKRGEVHDVAEFLAARADHASRLAKQGTARHWLEDREPNVGQRKLTSTQAPPRQYLLTVMDNGMERGFLPGGRVGMLAAEGGAGKSWALADLGISIATGQSWLGKFNVKRTGKVLLLLAEEETDEFHYRLEELVRDLSEPQRLAVEANLDSYELAGEDVDLIRAHDEVARGASLYTDTFRALMRRAEEHGPYSLIVFDTLSRFGAIDTETDNAAAARMIRTFEKFSHAPGRPTVLFTHHTTKSSRPAAAGTLDATSFRGASALSDNARWQATLQPRARHTGAPRLVDFRVVKSNYGWMGEGVVLHPDPDRSGMLTIAPATMVLEWMKADRAAGEEATRAKAAAARKVAPRTGEKDNPVGAEPGNDPETVDADDPFKGLLG